MEISISFPEDHEHSLRKTTMGCCGGQADEPPPKGSPCQFCGETKYSAITAGKLTIFVTGPETTSKRKARITLTCDQKHWHDGDKSVFVERTIDKSHNIYKERVIDPESGEVIHRCEEPLSSHQNHGSAKSNTS